MKYDLSYLDRYISGNNLTFEEHDLMPYFPLRVFAYQLESSSDFEMIRDRLNSLKSEVYAGWCLEEVKYILNKTGLTKRQKFQLKRMYKRD